MYIIMEGNAFDGVSFYGTFNSSEEAIEYACNEGLDEWTVCPLIVIEEQ